MANTAQPMKKTTRLDAVTVRARKMSSGTSGLREKRASIATNAPSRTRPAPIVPSVAAEPQPLTSVRTIPKVTSTRPAVTVKAPSRS